MRDSLLGGFRFSEEVLLERFSFWSEPKRDQRQRPDLPIRIQILILLEILQRLHAG